MGKGAAEQIKNTKQGAHLMKFNLALVMALNLTERVHVAKMTILILVLKAKAVSIIMRIMIKVRTLELFIIETYIL